MKPEYSEICDRTQRRDERLRLRNKTTGETALSYGCTLEGDTVQVELEDGSLDSWIEDDCEIIS